MTRYAAVLFAPDGASVADYRESESIEAVWERIADQGSRWFFYPFPVVVRNVRHAIRDTQRIVDAPEMFAPFKGRTLATFARWLRDNPETVEALLRF